MIEAASVASIERDQLRKNSESIWGSILGGIQFIFHCIGICELLYAKRMEDSKISHSSYYQNIVKYGPRVVDNNVRNKKKSKGNESPVSISRSSTPSGKASPDSTRSTTESPENKLYLSSKYETA